MCGILAPIPPQLANDILVITYRQSGDGEPRSREASRLGKE